MWWDISMGPVVGCDLCQNFGDIRDYCETITPLLEQMGAMGGMLFHRLPPCLEFGGCSATIIAPPTRPAVPAAGRWPDVWDVHLTAQVRTVSADTV
jgi:hypothetical protein